MWPSLSTGKQEIRVRSVEKHVRFGSAELQISPLRFAPVEMTKGRGAVDRNFRYVNRELQIPRLRY
jgi:hypothetical protein